ncbi:rRNA-processing protein FCF1 [Nocardiopsis arvandica]|uniref:rRNA-processing protein FCF1 n=1 Tax=Nocardiopsis sinuspersici TaxID=501010 RepID=A0A7Z0BJF2_9ACTN|nr:PIN domain-containing protein [Nocardiopsis sinuspersici]NYH51362.1 rRNA-processing protein FCF1 [Nocardiopsis sinuspersici]
MPKQAKPPTYLERLLLELSEIHESYRRLLNGSSIENVYPNSLRDSSVFMVAAEWGWSPSSPELEGQRMALLRELRDWGPRFALLYPHPTPSVAEVLKDAMEHLERWLMRPEDDHSVPSTISQAHDELDATVQKLRDLAVCLPADEHAIRLVVDTNTLIDDPDLAVHTATIGPRYRVHLLPVVLRELDDHKRAGRNQDLREAAKRADRRLKGLRNNGDVRRGVTVADQVSCVFEHIEPRTDGLHSWLDLDVPDDRFVASALRLQSDHPGSALYVATSDINLQTKLTAVGLPFVEMP